MASINTIKFRGEFDGTSILNSLKKIKQEMISSGANSNLFKGVDKDIASTEKLIQELTLKVQKGFSSSKEVENFSKQLDKLQNNFLKINNAFSKINVSNTFNLNSGEIKKLSTEIETLRAAQQHLSETAKSSITTQANSLNFTKKEIKEIQNAVDAQENLEEVITKVAKAKEKAAKVNINSKALESDKGSNFIKNSNFKGSINDLGIQSINGRTGKGTQDIRLRDNNGKLIKDSEGNTSVDITKANTKITELYQNSLEKVIKTGGDAAEAVKYLKEAVKSYGAEITSVEKLQESFSADIENFSQNVLSSSQKGSITKSTKAGRTDGNGNFTLSPAAQDMINNQDLKNYQNNINETAQKEKELKNAQNKQAEESNKNIEKFNEKIKTTTSNINNQTKALKEDSLATLEVAENAEKMDNVFDNMKNYVKNILSITSAFQALKDVISQTFHSVENIDKAFANIAMVTDYSVKDMWESYDQYAEMANRLGQQTENVIKASGLYYQQGV